MIFTTEIFQIYGKYDNRRHAFIIETRISGKKAITFLQMMGEKLSYPGALSFFVLLIMFSNSKVDTGLKLPLTLACRCFQLFTIIRILACCAVSLDMVSSGNKSFNNISTVFCGPLLFENVHAGTIW